MDVETTRDGHMIERAKPVKFPDGNIFWYKDGMTAHRDNGPAEEHADGTLVWRKDGMKHREDGPAYIGGHGGLRSWWKNGLRHREDGPAMIYGDGKQEWYLFGEEYNCLEWMIKVHELKSK